MKTVICRIWRVFSVLVLILIVLIALLLVGCRIAGMQAIPAPAGGQGSLLLVKTVAPSRISEGDAVLFRPDGGKLTAGKIKAVYGGGDSSELRTFSAEADGTGEEFSLEGDNVIGIVRVQIPGIGAAVEYFGHAPGLYIALAVVVVAALGLFLPGLLLPEKKKV